MLSGRKLDRELLGLEQKFWAEGFSFIGGVDEVGRGPLAGPVVAACVVLPRGVELPAVNDSKQLTEKRREELEKRFPPGFLRQAGGMEAGLFAGREAALAWERGASYVQAVGEGGVKAALWEMAKVLECGVDMDLKALPIRQETVEICEYLGVNPYQLSSTGSLLITAPEGEALAGKLAAAGIPAAVVGRLTDNNDKILRSGEEVQYLDRPAPDEIRKIYT